METEAKFYLVNMPALEARLKTLRAGLKAPRVHEYNLRFDTPEQALAKSFQVLRLRRNGGVHITYKGPGEMQEGVRVREEIEFSAGDFDKARAFFEALGYHVSFIYEKYRTTYGWGETEIMLDETPLGNFAEIEGPDVAAIREAATKLGLEWDARINDSYFALFIKAQTVFKADFRDMTFDNFKGLNVSAEMLGARSAD